MWRIRNSSQQDTQSLETDTEKFWLTSQTRFHVSLGARNPNTTWLDPWLCLRSITAWHQRNASWLWNIYYGCRVGWSTGHTGSGIRYPSNVRSPRNPTSWLMWLAGDCRDTWAYPYSWDSAVTLRLSAVLSNADVGRPEQRKIQLQEVWYSREPGFQHYSQSICPFSVSSNTRIQAEMERQKNECVTIGKKGNKGKMLRGQRLTTRSKRTMEKGIENIPFYR